MDNELTSYSLKGLFFALLTASITSLFLVLANPNHNQGWLAWIGLIPLFFYIALNNPKRAFLASYLCGMLFFSGVFVWIYEIPGVRWIHHMILAIYVGVYFGFFGLITSFISRRSGAIWGLFAAPFVWTSLEYVRSNLSFLALPWPLLAHSQHEYLPVIQIAAFTGAYGVSFLIAMANSALAGVVLVFWFRLQKIKSGWLMRRYWRASLWLLTTTCVLILAAVSYGQAMLSRQLKQDGVKITVVQGNIDQRMKSDPRQHGDFIMRKYATLTRKASTEGAELIVWPEAATPGFVLKSSMLLRETVDLIRDTGRYFIIGSSEYPKFNNAPMKREKYGNTALFFTPEGKVAGQYLKIRLIPFGEYIPYEDRIDWPTFIVPDRKRGYEIPGRETTLFELKGIKFGVIICWESHFSNLFREFVKNGARFMVNITNEGWFGKTAAPYQKLITLVFRAVENRIAVARSANTGVSCFIDPYGRIIGKVSDGDQDIFVDGFLTDSIPIHSETTFYTTYGDFFAFMAILVSFFMFSFSVISAKRESV